jgi:hypothetical protein
MARPPEVHVSGEVHADERRKHFVAGHLTSPQRGPDLISTSIYEAFEKSRRSRTFSKFNGHLVWVQGSMHENTEMSTWQRVSFPHFSGHHPKVSA